MILKKSYINFVLQIAHKQKKTYRTMLFNLICNKSVCFNNDVAADFQAFFNEVKEK